MEKYELMEWIHNNICFDFLDYNVNQIYKIVNKFNPDLLQKMLKPYTYKQILANMHYINPCLMDFDTITDNLKDLILIEGSRTYIIDDYMDWEGFTQEEIDSEYEEYEGQYIRCDDLQELYDTIEKYIIK